MGFCIFIDFDVCSSFGLLLQYVKSNRHDDFYIDSIHTMTVQLVVFMHARETDDSKSIFMTLYCAIFLALITVFGTILCMIWGWSY